jgi:hypothetical protein
VSTYCPRRCPTNLIIFGVSERSVERDLVWQNIVALAPVAAVRFVIQLVFDELATGLARSCRADPRPLAEDPKTSFSSREPTIRTTERGNNEDLLSPL